MLFVLPLLAAVTLAGQSPDHASRPADARPRQAGTKSVTATRAAQPPTIDGRDDDAVWREAPPIREFEEWRPNEGGPPKLPTEAKVAYDAGNLYVLVRCFDPHPDSIITVLARRDYFTPSDMVWLFLDSYHDRRTGFEFGVNPSGVKLDAQIFNDGNEDFAWDAVWDVATRIDSTGWTAEFRIPLSQLPYGRQRSNTFGLTVDRDLYRYAQRVSWPIIRQSQAGFVSQFGEIDGLEGLEAPRRLEAAPYLVTKNVSEFNSTGIGRTQDVTVGGDRTDTIGGKHTEITEKEIQMKSGKKIQFEAADEITLKSGDASIVLKKDGTIEIKGKDIKIQGSGKISLKADGDIAMKGSKIAQN